MSPGAWMKKRYARFDVSSAAVDGRFCGRGLTVLTETQALRLDAIQTHKWTIMTCSAMTGRNLQEGLQWVVQDAKDRLFLY